MRETFNHKAESSFYLWFDNYLLDKGQAYINETGLFYPAPDSTRPGFSIYSSQYKQLVWDYSITGATVMSGVYNSSGFIPNNSGIKVDYQNGRVLCDAAQTNLSGVFSRKEFNVYPTNEADFPLELEKIMGNNPNIGKQNTGISPYNLAAPCCLISLSSSENTPFAFGGQDITNATARVLVVSKDKWQMDGILSIFRDSNNSKIPLIPASGVPLDFYGNLKFNYNYRDLYSEFCGNGFYVDRVITSKVAERTNKASTYFVSSLEFELKAFRYPRREI